MSGAFVTLAGQSNRVMAPRFCKMSRNCARVTLPFKHKVGTKHLVTTLTVYALLALCLTSYRSLLPQAMHTLKRFSWNMLSRRVFRPWQHAFWSLAVAMWQPQLLNHLVQTQPCVSRLCGLTPHHVYRGLLVSQSTSREQPPNPQKDSVTRASLTSIERTNSKNCDTYRNLIAECHALNCILQKICQGHVLNCVPPKDTSRPCVELCPPKRHVEVMCWIVSPQKICLNISSHDTCQSDLIWK